MNKANFSFITGYSNGGFVTQTKPNAPSFEDWYDKTYSIWEQDEVTKAFKFTKAEVFSLLPSEEQLKIKDEYFKQYPVPVINFFGSYLASWNSSPNIP